MRLFILLFGVILAPTVFGQFIKDRICSSTRHFEECNQLQRGSSEVSCVFAQDAIECAQRIRNGTAEFGVFTAENAYHIASLGWEDLTVIKEIRHNDRLSQQFDFQSVAIVRINHSGGVNNLRGADFCHPGLFYERGHRWTERFLKHFERTLVSTNCSFDGSSAMELEVSGLSNFFNAACRPGTWSHDPKEDEYLKSKYPNLCSLCDNQSNCSYAETPGQSSHQQALECVRKSSNAITYVALQEAQAFFEANPDAAGDFAYLCPNGTILDIPNHPRPCAWLSQPWKLIISNNQKAISLAQNVQRWMNSNTGWESYLRDMILPDSSTVVAVNAIVPLPRYINPIRPVPVAIETACPTPIRWCTHSYDEKEKCEVIRTAALSTGIIPFIFCNDPRSDSVSCLSDVSGNRADFVGIDSNFGFLARNPYNLTGVLYEETEFDKYSSVVAVIKESDVERIKSFEDFRGKRACFGEFGGIASIAFINVAKSRGIFKREDCEFGQLLGGYFGDSCLPGSRSIFHDPKTSNPESLCTLCQTHLFETTTVQAIRGMSDQINGDGEEGDGEAKPEGDGIEGADDADTNTIPIIPNRSIDCAAGPMNRFYGSRGALTCLAEVGEIAVVEHQNLTRHAAALNIDPTNFRILCRNGSLAANPGFDVDPSCFLTTIVDGEVVTRRNSDKNAGIINALLSLDKYLLNDPDFKMYNIFAGERNLLFEDSALGLVSPNSTQALSQSVQNYIKLFEDVDNCIEEKGGAMSITINVLLTSTLVLFASLISN